MELEAVSVLLNSDCQTLIYPAIERVGNLISIRLMSEHEGLD